MGCRASSRVLSNLQAWAEPHVQAFLGPHGDRHLPLHGVARRKVELVALGDHGQKQWPLHQSEVVSYALVLTRPEWDECKVVVRGSPLGREALGLEAGRLLPESRMAMDVVDAD